MSDFDAMLWRPIKPGKEFDSLMPKSKCQTTYLGDGLTDFSINKMEQWVLDHATQTEQLAKVLKKQSLKSTCETIHSFLFNHFQYKADDSDQMLRSPACSWHVRQSGIDCKSYTITAVSLLLNMKITSYIRKIKQPGYAPDEFTHVYVIVPIDQTNGTLKKGYYTIDGTIPNMIEPAFIGTSDLKMSGNRHYGLNAVNGISFKDFSFKNLSNILKSYDCIGFSGFDQSAYSETQLNTHLDTVDTYFRQLILKINNAATSNNNALFSTLINEFFGNSKMFVLAAQRNKMKGWNSCTSRRIDVNIKQYTFYRDQIGALLRGWLEDYFNAAGVSGSVVFDNTQTAANYPGMRHVSSVVVQTVTEPKINYTQKNIAIPAFEINEYVFDRTQAGQPLDVNAFLDLLEMGTKFIKSPSNNNNPNAGGSYVQDLDDDGKPKAKTMGAGTVVGGLIVAGGLYYALNQGATKKDK